MPEPDWEKLAAVREELEALETSGELTPEHHRRLYAAAVKASAGRKECLEMFEDDAPALDSDEIR